MSAMSEWVDARRRHRNVKTYRPEGNVKADLDVCMTLVLVAVSTGLASPFVAWLLGAQPFGRIYGYGWLASTGVVIAQAIVHGREAYDSQEQAERSATRLFWSAIVCLAIDTLLIPVGMGINHFLG